MDRRNEIFYPSHKMTSGGTHGASGVSGNTIMYFGILGILCDRRGVEGS